MSQHIFTTTYNGNPISILLGWDRPLQGFFMVIEHEECEASEDFDDDYLYSNLDDEKLLATMGMSGNLDYFVHKLTELDITVPTAIFDNVKSDAADNVGNKYVVHRLVDDQLVTEIRGG